MRGLLHALVTGRVHTDDGDEELPRRVIWRLWSDQHIGVPETQLSCGCRRNRLTRRLTLIRGGCPRHSVINP